MSTRVRRALGIWGSRKSGTALEMASMPVMADPPLAKARRKMNSRRPARSPAPAWVSGNCPGLAATWRRWPSSTRWATPATITEAMLARNQ